MNSKLKNFHFIYRKLKISDYKEFKKLFYSCFKRNISFDFFKWRYFSNRSSFCYGVFVSSKLIANVGMVSVKLNNNKKIYSRHSSMVLKKYRGIGIFSKLLKIVKNKVSKKSNLIIMWPNKNNFAKFGINKNKIINRKYYLYETSSTSKFSKHTKNIKIDELIKFKDCTKSKNSFFLKNFVYYKNRYLDYRKKDYFINRFDKGNLKSFFIIKVNKVKSNINYVILDHFGSEKIKSKHLSDLIMEKKKLIFLSKKKINKTKFKLLNYLYFRIGILKQSNIKQKKNYMLNKEIFLGDTDVFITIG